MKLLSTPFYQDANGVGDAAYFEGMSAQSTQVPFQFPVAIGGRNYMVDYNQPFYRQQRRQLAQLIRTQADTSTEPGEQSMDPNSLWRRSFEDWSYGAGQTYLDRPPLAGQPTWAGSLANSFRSSKGIDALTNRWQIQLLPDTSQWRASVNTNLQILTVGAYVYIVDNQNVYYASSIGGSFTAVSSTPAAACSSICTDGNNVWMAFGASGIYHTTAGSASAADQWVTSAVNAAAVLGYCNGRLMLGSGSAIYNIVAATGNTLPAALLTFGYGAGTPGNGPTVVGFAEGTGAIYAGVVLGGKSYIYGMTVTSDGTALGAPVIQGQLPLGETISSIFGYLTFLFVGTSSGVRMCSTASSGGVSLGTLIPTPAAVKCLAGWGNFVYFGWTTYDGVSSGLGKMNLQNQVIPGLLPAYCSDLMVTTQAAITSVTVYNGSQLFTVNGVGFYDPSANLVPSGTIKSGYIMYDLTDLKIACLLDCQTDGPLTFGSYSAQVAVDKGAFNSVGQHLVGQPEPVTFGIGSTTGQRFEVQITLNRDATTTTAGPTFTRWTLRSYPAPKRAKNWQLPLILNENVSNMSYQDSGFDPLYELQFLENLAQAGQMTTFQEGNNSYPVFVQDVEFLPSYTTEKRQNDPYYNGIALVTLVGLPT